MLRTFYQHQYARREYVFSGRLPGIEVPSMTFDTIRKYYLQTGGAFRLVLKNGLHLSIYKANFYFYEIMEVGSHDEVTRKARYIDADDFGVETVEESQLLKRIIQLGDLVL